MRAGGWTFWSSFDFTEETSMIKRNVFLYKITNRDDDGYSDHPFEAALLDLMNLEGDDRNWQYNPNDDESFMRLLQFDKLNKNSGLSKCYAGIIAVYGSNVITTGRDDNDLIKRYPLPDGQLPVQVVHFLYYADKGIMALEYNRNVATNVKILAYINNLIPKLSLSDKLSFIGTVVCYPDAVELIRQANRIKSAKIFVPRQAIAQNNKISQLAKSLLSAPSINNHTDTLGTVVIEFRPNRGKFLSPGSYIDRYVNEFPGVEKQVYEVEIEEGMETAAVNIMQPQFKNAINLPDSSIEDREEYDKQVFAKIHDVYTLAADVISGTNDVD